MPDSSFSRRTASRKAFWPLQCGSLFAVCLSLSLLAGCGGSNASLPASPKPVAKNPTPKTDVADVKRTKDSDVEIAADTRPPVKEQKTAPQPVFRPSDTRPPHHDEKPPDVGIHKYTSRRLLLYTDIPAEAARPLPELMDRVYEAWESYFGPLPPDREKTDYQMTGYLMADRDKFKATGLLPEDLPHFNHGRHRGQEFWLNDQPTDYYRRHLVLHEGTHCFMTAIANPMTAFVWYMEGMAELFGTHETDAEGRTQFGVMPADKERFQGLGRIRLIEDEVREKGPRSMSAVVNLKPDEFLKTESYAWSWALCHFLDHHPRYRDRFRKLGSLVTVRAAPMDFAKVFEADLADLEEEWLLFSANLCHGYDLERAVIDFRRGKLLPAGKSATVAVAADRGWQSSRVMVEKGKTYQLTATGRFTLAEKPKPWESEPQGVSFRYVDGRPLGMLVACIRNESPNGPGAAGSMQHVISIGRDAAFKAETTGTVYLRLNDAWNELADNTGDVSVELRQSQ